MNKLSVRNKLALSFGIVVLIIAVVIGVSLFSFERSDAAAERTESTYEVINTVERLRVSLSSMQAGIRGFALSGEDAFLAPYDAGQTEYAKAVEQLKALVATNAVQLSRVADLEMLMLEWQEDTVVPMMTIREQVNSGLDIMQSMEAFVRKGTGREGMNLLNDIADQIVAEERLLLDMQNAEQASQKRQALVLLLGSGALAIVIAVFLAAFISSNLSRRLKDAVAVAQATAAGDLTVPVRVDGSDEVSALMRAIAEMQTRLRDMLGQIVVGAEQLATASTQLSTTSTSLEQSSDRQSEASSSMAAAVEELTVSINHVAEGAGETATIARESDRIAGEGSQVLTRTVKSIQQISERVSVTAQDVEALVRQSEEISTIVKVIKEIAEQTNLLALNAAIEAARAGEQGRGFAVVADEVRKLAERTAVSTQEIGSMIQEIQSSTGRAVEAMRSSIEQVNEGVALANEAGDVIGRIAQGARKVVDHASSISDALKEQTVVSDDVAGNVERIARMADDNNRSVRETGQTVRNLEQLGRTLSAAVQRFRLA